MSEREESGLTPEVTVPKLAVALQPADFSEPVLARYNGAQIRESKNFGRDQRLHLFELGAEFGRVPFALWGSVQLDLKLGQIPKTAIVVLHYQGKSGGERGQHNWSVRQFRGTAKQLQALASDYRQGSKAVADAIAYLEARSGQGGEAFDDDLPF